MTVPDDLHDAAPFVAEAPGVSVPVRRAADKPETCTLPTVDLAMIATALQPRQRLMGLDLGEKTIGLALSDVELTIASPLETIRRVKFTKDVEAMLKLAAKLDVGGLVLGLPLNMDGTEGPRAQSTRAFARNLERLTTLPVAFFDERMSTLAVTRTLLSADASRARRAELVDKMAAAWLLQAALETIANTG
jgi:putative Holliday junction resolvase